MPEAMTDTGLIAVQKIFGMEGSTKTLGDVKLASTPK